MSIGLCVSCTPSKDYIYQVRDQQQLQNREQAEAWKIREEKWLQDQQSSFRPDPNRLLDVLV